MENRQVALYGFDTFCLVLAQLLDVELLTPKDEIIADLDQKWIQRKLEIKAIADLPNISFPIFIKPVVPKQFRGAVYQNEADFRKEIEGLESETKIIISEIIKVEAEVRVFVLDGKVLDLAFYEGGGSLADAKDFANDFLTQYRHLFPKTFVLDLGLNDKNEWFVMEFNSTWGAGLNGCDAELVLEAIEAATV